MLALLAFLHRLAILAFLDFVQGQRYLVQAMALGSRFGGSVLCVPALVCCVPSVLVVFPLLSCCAVLLFVHLCIRALLALRRRLARRLARLALFALLALVPPGVVPPFFPSQAKSSACFAWT